MATSSVLSVRVNAKDEEILTKMAEVSGSTKSKLVAEAIHNYVEMNEWYMQMIAERVEMANKGEFATDKEMQATYAKYGVDYKA